MLDSELRQRAAAWAERTAVEQGLPPRIENIAVLREILNLFGMLDSDGNPVEATA